jgi:hypothetical protein
MPDLPVACTLGPAALAARRAGLLSELARRADRRDEIPDGYRFTFRATSDALALILKAVDAERQCCRFLRFQLTVDPDEGPVRIELTGPAGTREFLAAMFES